MKLPLTIEVTVNNYAGAYSCFILGFITDNGTRYYANGLGTIPSHTGIRYNNTVLVNSNIPTPFNLKLEWTETDVVCYVDNEFKGQTKHNIPTNTLLNAELEVGNSYSRTITYKDFKVYK